MKSKVEGIILSKVLVKEKDLICSLLLRSGRKISVYLYGAHGGSKKRKSSIIELGHLIEFQLNLKQKQNDEVFSVKEYQLKWAHEHLRFDFKAYYLLSFFTAIGQVVAMKEDILVESPREDDLGVFRVFSNALYYLDESVKNKQFHRETHIALFLTKLIFELGVAPDLNHCVLCDIEILKLQELLLSAEKGGFICSDCLYENKLPSSKKDIVVYQMLRKVSHMSYKNYAELGQIESICSQKLLGFLCYQFNLDTESFLKILAV